MEMFKPNDEVRKMFTKKIMSQLKVSLCYTNNSGLFLLLPPNHFQLQLHDDILIWNFLNNEFQYWEDRLLRAKALGLNTIQAYVPWNLHEPRQGHLVFEGIADIILFLKLCKKLDLLVMLRAGPYICGGQHHFHVESHVVLFFSKVY